MTLEELRTFIEGRELPTEIRIGPDMMVTDVDKFLTVQFMICESWTKDLNKCPEYLRLLNFKKALEALDA